MDGRKHHVTEDVILHHHGLPPLPPSSYTAPRSSRSYHHALSDYTSTSGIGSGTARSGKWSHPSASPPPAGVRHYEVDQRYKQYRSRSQDPMLRPRQYDKWLQTEEWAAERDDAEGRGGRSRASARSHEHTYRSYSSHLYSRRTRDWSAGGESGGRQETVKLERTQSPPSSRRDYRWVLGDGCVGGGVLKFKILIFKI